MEDVLARPQIPRTQLLSRLTARPCAAVRRIGCEDATASQTAAAEAVA
jgi:hypothetical protein